MSIATIPFKTHKLSTVLASLLLVTACGGGGGSSTPAPTPSPTPTPAPTPTPTPTPMPGQPDDGLAALSPTTPDASEHLAGGNATTTLANADAFGQRPAAIASNFELDANFTSGDHIFRTPEANGIGPLFNARTCQGCHLRDGRGVVPNSPNQAMRSMFLRLSQANGTPDPTYGGQLQTFGVDSMPGENQGLPSHGGALNGDLALGEAFAYITYEEITGQYPDGDAYSLRKPTYHVKDLSYGDFSNSVRFSPRVTPSIFGSGLLEAIPAEYITAYADENDVNNDGISGRAAMVSSEFSNEPQLGRFGYKASNSTVLQQVAGAYRGDIGLTNKIFTAESCTSNQLACENRAAEEVKSGAEYDLSDVKLALVEFYNRVLAVPERRGKTGEQWDADVLAGRKHFFDMNCSGCHVPRHKTGEAAGSELGDVSIGGLDPDSKTPIAVLSNQVIYPYTDLLLHDMGGSCQITRELTDGTACTGGAACEYVQRCDGLADGRSDGPATEVEWKTPALWGLGLVKVVNPQATFLHDGRARSVEEAILWHGGEANAAKQAFMQLTRDERSQVITFLNSL